MWDWDYNEAYVDSDSDWRYTPKCRHEWKAVLLLTSTVYDCIHCGAKKEEVEDGKTTT